MTAKDIIQTALTQGQTALSEYDSKQVLAAYGVPVTREYLALAADEAVLYAERIGYPVALKACSADLMHKTESGLLALNLGDEAAVQTAYVRLTGSGVPMDGVLVQEMVGGPREIVVGLTRDPQFGPCVMLGLGGVLTEVIRDTVFRMAPFDRIEARDMCDQLRSRRIFEAFRGQAPADLDAVCSALTAVGEIGLDFDSVAEIDINPMIIRPDGRVTAADALLVLESNRG